MSVQASAEDDPGVVKSVRFTTAQYAGIQAEAKRLMMPVSTFIRMCALHAAGIVKPEELVHVRRVLALRHISKMAPQPQQAASITETNDG